MGCSPAHELTRNVAKSASPASVYGGPVMRGELSAFRQVGESASPVRCPEVYAPSSTQSFVRHAVIAHALVHAMSNRVASSNADNPNPAIVDLALPPQGELLSAHAFRLAVPSVRRLHPVEVHAA